MRRSEPAMAQKQNALSTAVGGDATGFTQLKRAVKELGRRAIDRRTALGRALDHWRNDLLSDLGGAEAASNQSRSRTV